MPDEVTQLDQDNVYGYASDLIQYADDHDIPDLEFLAALHVIIEEFAEKGIEIEISRSKDALS